MNDAGLEPLEAYRRMLVIRRFEQRCLELSHEGFIKGSIHLCLGQEAIPVGVCAAQEPGDRVVATYRGHGWAIARGVPLEPLLGEICQRAGGLNGGRCGSPLLSAPDYGLLAENSIVGAGVPVAAGAALAAQAKADGRVVVVSVGDGAMNQGSTNEGLIFAAVRNLPLVVVCENNGWSEMTASAEMFRSQNLSDRASGYHIPYEIVDGCDAEEVWDAASWALAEARDGRGPVFLECKTVRLGGHYNADIEHYRPAADAEDAKNREPLRRLRQRILEEAVASEDELTAVEAAVAADIDAATRAVRAMDEPPVDTAGAHVFGPPRPAPARGTEAARNGGPVELTYQRAVNLALKTELDDRPDVLVYGEDVGAAGGIFGVSRGLQKQFGPERVFDTPISESAILGSAVGAAMEGMRPVVEVMWGDFLLVALDQLVNQAANVRFVNQSRLSAAMVVRYQQGATPGACAQHSQSLEALLAHIPGLKLGMPATAADAYAMTRAAVADPDPVILAESRELYQMAGPVDADAAETVGGARVYGEGGDVAVITWGAMLHRAFQAADDLRQLGYQATVVDLRWLRPLDVAAIDAAVRSCAGRVVVAHEANLTGGFGAELAAGITERNFGALAAPVRRVAAPDVRVPAAPNLQAALLPSAKSIVEAAVGLLDPSRPRPASCDPDEKAHLL
ncbi:MAG TPA: thiamine pyrophosphate-dependent enzyme [Acidimicrobiales bacterium]|nr:thiamine pyrophosphate-dependent enzyme [Acidimicrobiales bacterium]